MDTRQDIAAKIEDDQISGQGILPDSKLARGLIGLITVVLPIISFALTSSGLLAPEWQSGSLSDYVEIMLDGAVAIYFFPFLIYSMISIILLLVSQDRYAAYFPVRFGINTGRILALQYSLILIMSSYDIFVWYSLFFWIIISLPWLHQRLRNWLQERGALRHAKVGVIVVAGLLLYSQGGPGFFGVIIFLFAFSIPAIGPIICLVIASQVSNRLRKRFELREPESREKIIAAVLWGLPYMVAWRFAVVRTLELYAELPTTLPGCYIATAAARGKPSLVKSAPIKLPGGKTLHINDQMRYLKCAELALRTIFPWGHRLCRRIYDHYGKLLSRKITTPTRAEFAYISLKPFEWGSRIVLKSIVPNIDEIATRLYSNI